MTGFEIDQFYNYDAKRYDLKKNKEFLHFYQALSIKGYNSYLNIAELQDLITEIVNFYEFKLPNNLLKNVKYSPTMSSSDYITAKIAKDLTMEQLFFRLHHDQKQFLTVPYPEFVSFNKNFHSLTITSNGNIPTYEIEKLKNIFQTYHFDTTLTIEELYKFLISSSENIDYEMIERIVMNHKYGLTLRNRLLELIPYALLYSENTLPIYGIYRTKSFTRMFNKEFNLDLNTQVVEDIIALDYCKEKVEIPPHLSQVLKKM